jgi:hypothetical protein
MAIARFRRKRDAMILNGLAEAGGAPGPDGRPPEIAPVQ